MSSSAKWQQSGVFFDNVAIRVVDAGADADRDRATMDPEGGMLWGLGAPAAKCGIEEFTIATPIPGCGGNGLWDGKAHPMIVFRLFLDGNEHLN